MHNRSNADQAPPTPPPRKTNSSVRRAIRPPPSSQSDNAITLPPEMEFAASLFREEPVAKPVRLHPLLLQNIERAKLLEAMMNSEPIRKTPAKMLVVGNHDNKPTPHNLANSLCSEGSSSDCVIVEAIGGATNGIGAHFPAAPTAPLHPFSVVGKSNGPTTTTTTGDQDSGVDVGGTVAAGGAAESTTPVKRKRGRPRKEPGTVSVK